MDGLRDDLQYEREMEAALQRARDKLARVSDRVRDKFDDACREGSEVTRVELTGFGLDAKDAAAVAWALDLENNDTLAFLSLAQNNIRDEGVKALVEPLVHNGTLRTLSIGENSITDEGAYAIANMLRSNYALERLYCNRNQIHAEGGAALLSAVYQNTSLSFFDLDGNASVDTEAIRHGLAVKTHQTMVKSASKG